MKKMLFVLLALLIVASPLFAAGQQEKKDEPVTLNVLFYSPELAEQYNDMVAEYKKLKLRTCIMKPFSADFSLCLVGRR